MKITIRSLYALLITCIVFAAPAQRVDVISGLRLSITRVLVEGEAQFYSPTGAPEPVGISGWLSLYESGYGANDMPWTSFNGYWKGGFSYNGDYNNCYQAVINGHAMNTGVSYYYSPQSCTGDPPYNPPGQHGYDICPLILDLDGDGVPTTGLEDAVSFFDTNRDGVREPSGWTTAYSRDAFLWMDMNGNHDADPGELFGAGMPLPAGGYARNGFQALKAYDENADGLITKDDAVWNSLRLWIDANHDGVSTPQEISTPGAAHLVSLDLAATAIHRQDSRGNVLMFASWFDHREHQDVVKRRLVDISFIPGD